MLELDSQIETVLFFLGEPVSIKKLSAILNKEISEIKESLSVLEERLKNGGLELVWNGEEVMLGTKPDASATIEKITKEELTRDLGKAGLETISIVLYKHPISKREVDYIRGVNSSFVIRNLLVRGLIERAETKGGERSYSYRPTMELLTFMGIKKIEDLPEYAEVTKELEEFNRKTSNEIALEAEKQ